MRTPSPTWLIAITVGTVAAAPFAEGAATNLAGVTALRPHKRLAAQEDLAVSRNEPVALRAPPLAAKAADEVRVDLTMSWATNEIAMASNEVLRLCHMSYNGAMVGPTIRVRPGTTLDVVLENRLAPAPMDFPSSYDPHGNDVSQVYLYSNLHTHGLRVSPSRNSDNVFVSLVPGDRFFYRFEIPANHPAGTHWYHPHRHMSTAGQLGSGMAGALIIEGGLDDAPELRGVEEKIFVLQNLWVTTNHAGQLEVDPHDVYHPEDGSGAIVILTVNGQLNPRIEMRPGEIQRWRFVHAGVEESIHLQLQNHVLHEIAKDGIATGEISSEDTVELQPGYRSDLLVQAGAQSGSFLLIGANSNHGNQINGFVGSAVKLATVAISGPPRPMPLPSADVLQKYAPYRTIEPSEIVGTRAFSFELVGGVGEVSGRPFTPGGMAVSNIVLGTAEEWTLQADALGHPIHVHVNPFQVLTTNQAGDVKPVWRDTYFVPRSSSVTIRSRFEDFAGDSVLHCHILTHEDAGMMQEIQIRAPKATLEGKNKLGPELATAPRPLEKAPGWRVRSAAGAVVTSAETSGRRRLLVFNQGVQCLHCAQQLRLIADSKAALQAADVSVIVISPSAADPRLSARLKSAGVDFPMLTDPTREAFRRYGCAQGDSLKHGLFLIGRDGRIEWSRISESAELDLKDLWARLKRTPST